MKLLDDVRLPVGLDPAWTESLFAELEAAEKSLPELSPTAIELAELAVSGEYDAEIVGAVLERDEKLRDQVLRMANSAVYAGSTSAAPDRAASRRARAPRRRSPRRTPRSPRARRARSRSG